MTMDYNYTCLAKLYDTVRQNDFLFLASNYHWVIGCDILERAFGDCIDLNVIRENEEFELFGIKGTTDIDCPNRIAIFRNVTDELFLKIKQMEKIEEDAG